MRRTARWRAATVLVSGGFVGAASAQQMPVRPDPSRGVALAPFAGIAIRSRYPDQWLAGAQLEVPSRTVRFTIRGVATFATSTDCLAASGCSRSSGFELDAGLDRTLGRSDQSVRPYVGVGAGFSRFGESYATGNVRAGLDLRIRHGPVIRSEVRYVQGLGEYVRSLQLSAALRITP